MAFRKVSDPAKYFDFKTTKAGTVLVQNGVYVGAKEGNFGLTHYFRDKEGAKEKVGISGGQLNYLVENGEIEEGCSYRVTFDGKDLLQSGPYKGKEVNKFSVELDEDSVASAPQLKQENVSAGVLADIDPAGDITL